MADNTNIDDANKQQYQDILDKYSAPPEPQVAIKENIVPPVEIKPPQSNLFKYIFFIVLFIFIGVVGILAFTLTKQPGNSNQATITPTPAPTNKCLLNEKEYGVGESFAAADGCNTCSCASDLSIACTDKTCAPTPTIKISPASTPSTVLNKKTNFQQLIISWDLYKEIETTKKSITFPYSSDNNYNKLGDKLYDFTQKLINGSVKEIIISKKNLSTILGDHQYTFYITPNYEQWSNEKFNEENFIPMTGIGDPAPAYAYPDKLVWTTAYPSSCGGVRSDIIEEQKAQDQCELLVKEVSGAFL